MTLTLERLKEVLNYNPTTGELIWRIQPSHGPRVAGSVAGSLDKDGYVVIKIDGKKYKAHRLVWFYTLGVWPERVDHENRIKNDNRIENLRIANSSDNAANSYIHKYNTSGFRGVHFSKASRKWWARIMHHGKRYNLGLFNSIEEAARAYESKFIELYPSINTKLRKEG